MGVDHVLARLLSLLQEIGQERVIILGEFEVFPLFLDKAQALHHLKGRHVQQGVLAATGLLGFGDVSIYGSFV